MGRNSTKGGPWKNKPGGGAGPHADGKVFLQMNKTDQRHQTIRSLLMLPSLAVPILAGIPIAKMFAGTQTDINVSLTATLGITLVGVGGVATLWIKYQRRTISELRRDNKALRNGLMPPTGEPQHGEPEKPNVRL
jgi:hypothetical protein